MRTSILGAVAVVLGAAFAGNAGAQTVVSADVTTDTTWSGVVVLESPIFVRDGATLTIDAGTIVRGQPRTAAVQAGIIAGTPGALIVTQTGTIIANGTPSNPIIMTTAAVDNDQDGVADDDDNNGFKDAWSATGNGGNADLFLDDTPTTAPLAPLNADGFSNVSLWGGLVILGNATTNMGNNFGLGQGLGIVEGLTVPGFPDEYATYGASVGGDDADSSGSVTYVSVRHAGDEIGNSNELNGVTLAGVGSGTEFHHVEVYCNFDDGMEWFGGTVNGDHLQVVFAGDDGFDVDQGYRGTNQFMVAVLPYFNPVDRVPGAPLDLFGSAGGDKGCECDGDDDDLDGGAPSNVNVSGPNNQPTPFSNANFYNFTIAGSQMSTLFNGFVNNNDGWEMRNGFAGTINNGIIYNTGSAVQGVDLAGGGFPGWEVGPNANAGLIAASAITCDNVRAVPVAPSDEATVFANGTGNITCVNGVNNAGFRINQRDTAFTPTGVAGKLDTSLLVAKIDLRPSLPNATMANGLTPPAPLDTTATYRGAYDAVSEMWTTDWTALSQAGLQAVPEPGVASMLAAGAMGLLGLSRRRR